MKYQIELSETALGYSKVTDLLQDRHLHDLCTVQLQGRGYAVVEVMDGQSSDKARESLQPAGSQRVVFCPEEPLVLEDAGSMNDPNKDSKIFALSPSTLAKDGLVGCMVRDTFIHFLPPAQSTSTSKYRSCSVPKDFGSRRDSFETQCHSLAFLPRSLDREERPEAPHNCIDTPLPSPLAANGLQHADTPLLALEWGERCLSLGLVPWPLHLMRSPDIPLLPAYGMLQFDPGCDVAPCAQWCGPLDKICDNSTCADSAECDAASVPSTPSMASRLRRNEMSPRQTNSNASSSDGFTPRSAQGADVSSAEMTASQQHLMNLRASGRATLKVLASESSPSSRCHTDQHDCDWRGLEQWCSENEIACHHLPVSDMQGWRNCGDVRQDAFTVHSGLHTGLQWD